MVTTVSQGTIQLWSCVGLVLSGRTASYWASLCESLFFVNKDEIYVSTEILKEWDVEAVVSWLNNDFFFKHYGFFL